MAYVDDTVFVGNDATRISQLKEIGWTKVKLFQIQKDIGGGWWENLFISILQDLIFLMQSIGVVSQFMLDPHINPR